MKITSGQVLTYLAGVAFVVIAGYWVQGCKQQEAHENESTPELTDADYAGTESCRSCHEKQYADWRNSHHDESMMEASARSVKGDFDTTFTSQGITHTFFQKDSAYYVNTQGPDGAYYDYQVVYTFGTTPLQQYLIQFPNGRLQCLRAAWDTQTGHWFDLYPDLKIRPDEWLHWSRGGLNWNAMCSDCHSTNVHKNFNEATNSYHTTYSIIDVSCESCHGPARKHVEAAKDGFENYDAGRSGLFHTTVQSPHEQVDECARCHARRTQYSNAYNHQGEFMDHYAPEILRDQVYYPDGQIKDEDYVYGSFVQSKMYQNNVKCSNCHNPHSLKLYAEGNALCVRCHSNTYDAPAHHFHPVGSEGAQCINCHMPGRYYMGNDFRRDHSFRVPRPDLSVIYETPNACTGCHQDKTAAWAAAAIVKWYGPERAPHYSETLALGSTRTTEAVEPLTRLATDRKQPAIARATAIWYLDEIVSDGTAQAIVSSLESDQPIIRYTAVNALADLPPQARARYLAPLLKDSVTTVRLAAAQALAGVSVDQLKNIYRPDFKRSTHDYLASLNTRADFAGGQFEKARYLEQSGQPQEAEQAYLKAITIDDHFNAARFNLAYLYNSQGRNQEAITLFQKVIEQEPQSGAAYYSLGLLYAETNDMDRAIECLAKAADLEGTGRMYYNLGVAYQQTNEPAKAESAYRKGLSIEENNYDLMYAISTLYMQQHEYNRARPYLNKLVAAFPDNQQFRQMLDALDGTTP